MLTSVIAPTAVVSIREFFALRKAWPDELPGSEGDALVVAGLDGCLDALSQQDAQAWLESDLKAAVLSFQEHYEVANFPSSRRGMIYRIPFAALFLNTVLGRMYPSAVSAVFQRPWRMMPCSSTPCSAAVVAKPERSECAAKSSSRLTRRAAR